MTVQPLHSFSDAALEKSTQDRFRRAPFAHGIANTLSSMRDPTSIVIGIYGPWGDGKSSVLSFIKERLQQDAGIITMDFNPWRFGDEDTLLKNFFDSLVKQLNQSLSGPKAKINKWKDAVRLIPHFGDAAEKIIGKLTAQELDEFKSKTAEILKAGKQRIVVLMDDIDRLETGEIQAVFRLIKLTASFDYVAYVLAFDDKVVAAALQEKYGTVSQSGQGFLEKIVQVPLHLPKIPREDLEAFCRECVLNDALSSVNLELTRQEEERFKNDLSLIAWQIHTPRQCKRYANGVIFALGLLNGEVNTVDLLLIEALRIFHPHLYKIIRDNREFFISGEQEEGPFSEDEIMGSVWQGLTLQEKDALRKVLRDLFPDFETHTLQRQKTGLYDGLADRQRVASRRYFDRFFTYSTAQNPLQDKEIAGLLENISIRSVEQIAEQIQAMIDRSSPEIFIDQLGLRRELLGVLESPNLARGLAAVSENFPYLYEESGLVMHYSDAVHLVRQLVLNTTPILGERRKVLEYIVKEGKSLPFAYCCLLSAADTRPSEQRSWFEVYGGDAKGTIEPPITKGEFDELAPTIAKRILSYFDNGESFEMGSRATSKFLAEYWPNAVPKDELRNRLARAISANKKRAVGIIRWYLSDSFHDEPFGKERYGRIVDLVTGDALMHALEAEYGDALRSGKTEDEGLRFAQSFTALHKKYGQQENNVPSDGAR